MTAITPFRTEDEWQTAIELVRTHLNAAGVVAYPTETVYGLGARATDDGARSLAELKGYPVGRPVLIVVANRRMAETSGLEFTPAADALARACWPGPLTLVLSGGEGQLSDFLRGPEGGIAVRWTSHLGVQQLIAALGEPITSTSANRPGDPPAPSAAAVAQVFADAVRNGTLMVLDGGALGTIPASTVVDCTTRQPKLLREGALPGAALRRIVGTLAT